MELTLGKIVKSNGHTDYVCQIYGRYEQEPVPQPVNYALGTFVSVELQGQGAGYLVGLIYDTVLLNPDFGSLGPRLSPETELGSFAPDYLNERAVLVGITAIGRVDAKGRVQQGVPLLAANSDALVRQMNSDQIRAFHHGPNGLNLTYLPVVMGQSKDNPLAYHLARTVLDHLTALLPDFRAELDVLADNLLWSTQIGPMGGAQ